MDVEFINSFLFEGWEVDKFLMMNDVFCLGLFDCGFEI